jgi:hypothetical protein
MTEDLEIVFPLQSAGWRDFWRAADVRRGSLGADEGTKRSTEHLNSWGNNPVSDGFGRLFGGNKPVI